MQSVLPDGDDDLFEVVVENDHERCDQGRVGRRKVDHVVVVEVDQGGLDRRQVEQATTVTLHKLLSPKKTIFQCEPRTLIFYHRGLERLLSNT